MIPAVLLLRDFADPESRSLKTKQQAQNVIRALEMWPRRGVDLDFSGISEVSWEFTLEFTRLLQEELPTQWLAPKHYARSSEKLIALLVEHLERLREQEWIDGCARFSTAIDRLIGRR